MSNKITAETLALYAPFSGFKNPQFIADALQKGESLSMPEGSILFKRDAEDDYSYWLISGAVDLLDANFDVENIQATDESTRQPIDDNSPHVVTAVSTTSSLIFKLSRSDLEAIQNSKPADKYVVTSLAEADDADSDWMSSMLSSPLFDFVPPHNIQELFNRFEEVNCKKGDVIIQQGEPGDYFYVIQQGNTKVEYNTGDKTILLAELEKGAFFGEDALISDVPRNATITMESDGKLMRLSESDFRCLLQEPLIEKIDMAETEKMIEAIDPLTWILDVRTRQEFQESMIENSSNIP